MEKVLLVRNANKEEFYAYVKSLELNVDGVINVDVVDSKFFKNDQNLILNGELCLSVKYADCLNSIALFIETHDNKLETLLHIWNYTTHNYLVDILEDEF